MSVMTLNLTVPGYGPSLPSLDFNESFESESPYVEDSNDGDAEDSDELDRHGASEEGTEAEVCDVPRLDYAAAADFFPRTQHKSCRDRALQAAQQHHVHGPLFEGHIEASPAMRQDMVISPAPRDSPFAALRCASGSPEQLPVAASLREMVWAKCSYGKHTEHLLMLRNLLNTTLADQLLLLKAGVSGTVFNVMFVTLDSVSTGHFLRKLPRTANYIASLKSSERQGTHVSHGFPYHTVVGDGTGPNTISLLTGVGEATTPTWHKNNNLRYIFEDFAAAGYATMWGDDCSEWFP
eukprot:gene3705-4122_t